MAAVRYVHWQDDGVWLGYFEEFPDYITQGQTLAELQENLRDLNRDLTHALLPRQEIQPLGMWTFRRSPQDGTLTRARLRLDARPGSTACADPEARCQRR
jgi:predicted RNase H-like HicB family nuclease